MALLDVAAVNTFSSQNIIRDTKHDSFLLLVILHYMFFHILTSYNTSIIYTFQTTKSCKVGQKNTSENYFTKLAQ